MDAVAVDPAGDVALRGHGVEMAGQQHRRAAADDQAAVAEVGRADDRRHVSGQARLVARLGRDVDQLQRALRSQRVHAAARRSSSVLTSGATSVPKRSIERITAPCSTSPAAIWAR